MTHGIRVVRGIYDNPDDPGAISHFQALSAALSATVGLGNIGGVAMAIGAGGPGAVFWMWVVGFFGMALKSVEITLAMMYRNTDDPDNPHGGAMWVVEKVIGGKGGIWKPIARAIGVFFCSTLLISTFTGGNMFQAWSVATLSEQYFQIDRTVTGVVLAAIVGMVIIGGIKRIGTVAGKLVPFMCGMYLISALAVLAMNLPEIPGMLLMIVKSAFSETQATGAAIGGTVGYAFSQGLRRALFSNEAGQGSAPIAHAAAKTDEPAREGIVGGIGPFIDTLCICTLTALVILLTNTWNRPAVGEFQTAVAIESVSQLDGKPVAHPTWRIAASTDPADLPAPQHGAWDAGSKVFFLGEVAGATNLNTGGNRVRLSGKLTRPTEGGEAGLKIAWEPLSIKSSKTWQGTPTAMTLAQGKAVYRKYEGAQLTGHAFDRQFNGLGKYLVTIAAWLFAMSTMISWSYYGEQGVVYIVGRAGVLPYKLVFLGASIFAAVGIQDVSQMGIIMDLGTGAMLWANIPIVLGLGYLSVDCLSDYGRRLKAGEFPRTDG